MGILSASSRLLIEEAKQRPFSGRLLQLGRNSIYVGREELERRAERAGFALREGVETRLSPDPVLAAHGCLDDVTFFRLLGFDEIRSLDHTDWEGADFVHDLNRAIPAELAGSFDLVIDGGTLQSVFHVPRALENIHGLLPPGGRVIHTLVPSSNHVDLGFYMFSPTFFRDYYQANDWQVHDVFLCLYTAYWVAGLLRTHAFDVHEYRSGSLDHLYYGRFGGRQAGIWVSCTRTPESTADRIPQQSYYQRLWSGEETEPSLDREELAHQFAWKRRLGRCWAWYKLLAERLRRTSPKKLPRRVARY